MSDGSADDLGVVPIIPFIEYQIAFAAGALATMLSPDFAMIMGAIAFFGSLFGSLAYNTRRGQNAE